MPSLSQCSLILITLLLFAPTLGCPPPPDPDFVTKGAPGGGARASHKPGEAPRPVPGVGGLPAGLEGALPMERFVEVEAALRCLQGDHGADRAAADAAVSVYLQEQGVDPLALEKSRAIATVDRRKAEKLGSMIEAAMSRRCGDGAGASAPPTVAPPPSGALSPEKEAEKRARAAAEGRDVPPQPSAR